MTMSRFVSGWVKFCLRSHAMCVSSILFFLLVVCASGRLASAAAPAYVQQCNQYTAGGGSGATASCTLSSVGAGHALLIGIWSTDSALSSVTASSGTPTSVISAFNDNGYGYSYAYILPNTASGNITVSVSETGYYKPVYISASEFSNVAASSPVDATGTGQVNNWGAAEISTGSFTTTAASDMMWSLCFGLSGETFSAGTSPVTWTQISSDSSPVLFVEYGATSTAGSYTGQCYKSSTGYDTSIITVAFEPGGQAATPTFSPSAGTYASSQTVTISDSTSGSTIYYTTDGTTPTTASSTYSSAITVSANKTLEAIATASGYTESSVGSAAYVINGPAATPGFSPAAGAYGPAQSVTISDGTSGATIYYTTNGATPTTSSSTYSSAITVSATETLEAIAVAPLYTASAVGSAAYTINGPAATPGFSPAAGAYGPAQSVTISDGTSGATIYYTTNGTTPTTASATYSSAITVSATETLEAIATATSYTLSAVGSAAYTINGPAATPGFSPAAGAYGPSQSVTISDGTSGSTIYYTTNGSTPTTASATYSSAITVSATETLEAMATASGYSNSAVGSAAYTINGPATTPGFSPVAGAYGPAQSVTISDGTSGATIYYTTNGSTPTTASATYSSAITVSATETLEAMATASGYSNSAIGSAAYTINGPAATPGFSPAAGAYGPAQSVTISDSTSGATIYYTTNGTTPTTASTTYSSAITVSATETLEAMATASGYSNSAIGSAAYTINGPAATPSFSPAAGTYGSAQTVTIVDGTSGATIYFTTNGGTPTTASSIYSSAITVSATETLEAMATASGYSNSAVGSAAYTIGTPAYVQMCNQYTTGGGSGATASCTLSGVTAGDSLVIGIYTTDATLSSVTSSTTAQPTSVVSDYAGNNGYESVYLLPNAASGSITISATETGYYSPVWVSVTEYTDIATSPLDVSADASTGNTHYGAGGVDTGNFNTTTTNDLLWTLCVGLSGETFTAGTAPITWTQRLSTSNRVVDFVEDGLAATPGTYYGQCYKSSSGYDQDILTVALKSLGGLTQAATPNLSPAAGTYTSIQTVTITDSTAGATIYYTTNGTTPTTSSAIYSSPISVSTSQTIEAFVTASGYYQSNVASAAYVINLPAASTPVFSPAAGTYTSIQTVTMSDSTSGAAIYYTTNGSTPTTASSVYTSAITVSATKTLEAIAIATGYSQSATGSAAYTINLPVVATPGFSPAAGTYPTTQTVTISDGTSGATIYYTTNGTTPTTASSVYSSAISVSSAETLEALATHSGDTNSAVGSAAYNINSVSATPTFSPAAGTYTSAQTVTISDTTTGAVIYYTTNGTTPTTASSVYSSAITVSATETLEAIADASGGYTPSAVGSAAYTMQIPTPTFSPAAGYYSTTQTVTISDTASGATIYYTTNGVTPTTASATYSSAITVSANETIEAIATETGYANSAVGSAFYIVGSSGAPIIAVQHNGANNPSSTSLPVSFTSNVTSGDVILVAESSADGVSLVTPTDSEGNSFTQLVTAGTSGASAAGIYGAYAGSSGADTVTCNISTANNLHCHIYEVQGITTTVDQTGSSSQTSSSLSVSTSAATTNADDYVLAFFTDNNSQTTYTVGSGFGDAESTRESSGDSAFTEDAVVVATGVQTAAATSSNSSDTYVNVIVALNATGTPMVSTPTFSPAPGTYDYAQTITIGDWTAGESTYYTTDGTTPTTNSTLYTGPFNVSVTQTVEALAVASGFANSQVASATYTITPPASTPVFTPTAGSYSSTQTVTISDATSGATIYYTTNGFTPTTASAAYSSPINVSVWETLQAVAIAPGYSLSPVGVATYTIGNGETAAPAFSPGPGDYDTTQTITLSDETSGASIYYTTNGTTPTTASILYSSAFSITASVTIEAIATASGYTQSGVETSIYTINSTAGSCDGMSVGSSVAGTANMNGFVPFQSASNMTNQWDENIANASVDPNNAAIQTTSGFAGEHTHVNFGSSPGDGGIPFMIVDSGTTPLVPIRVVAYARESDNVVAPYPSNVPIEGNAADCSGWPDTYQSDSHTNVLDRNTCWDYETFNTNRCDGLYDADGEVIWDMTNGEMRPWGWTSTDAAGLSVMAGLVKYDEAASGHINHAIRYTMQVTKNDANNGYFVEPASHAAAKNYSYSNPNVEGMRIRLNSTFNISGYSAINQAILTAFQQYGMILADNGGYLYIQGATDSRWNDADLTNLAGIPASDFQVIDAPTGSTEMTPAYPGWDSVTAPTGSAPVINSFTSSAETVSAGTPVTFNFSVTGDSYDYIDMIGPVRLASGSGSVTIEPTATQTYTLYSVNQYGNNGDGAGYGVAVSTPITIVVPGSTVVAPTFTPAAGTYSTSKVVTFNTTTYPYATFYYTTDGSTPTYPPTGTTMEYPVIAQPMSSGSQGNLASITVSATSTIKAIAVAPGYSSPSAVSSATYTIN